MRVSGKTQVYGVIGDPIEHSMSPAMHNAAFERLGLDCVYVAFNVKPDMLAKAMRGVRGLGIRGLNLTMPHKTAVFAYLDEVDEIARFLGSVNTISNEDGRLKGFSTDGVGAVKALRENGVGLSGKRLLLLGAGGAARAIAYALAKEVKQLVILNRTEEKTKALAEVLTAKFNSRVVGGSLSPLNVQKNLLEADVLVNATSVGMHPKEGETLVKPDWLRQNIAVMDVVYNPVETRLARDAKKAGAKVVSGVEMLIHQGAASFEIWTGRPAPVDAMRKAALKQLAAEGESP
ncbi:MAG: shikimate dehydrogenase [Candidatus Bathyarchaeia archaeon]